MLALFHSASSSLRGGLPVVEREIRVPIVVVEAVANLILYVATCRNVEIGLVEIGRSRSSLGTEPLRFSSQIAKAESRCRA